MIQKYDIFFKIYFKGSGLKEITSSCNIFIRARDIKLPKCSMKLIIFTFESNGKVVLQPDLKKGENRLDFFKDFKSLFFKLL